VSSGIEATRPATEGGQQYHLHLSQGTCHPPSCCRATPDAYPLWPERGTGRKMSPTIANIARCVVGTTMFRSAPAPRESAVHPPRLR
jgi:hypothetical protein